MMWRGAEKAAGIRTRRASNFHSHCLKIITLYDRILIRMFYCFNVLNLFELLCHRTPSHPPVYARQDGMMKMRL